VSPKQLKLIGVLLGVAVLLYLLPRVFGGDEGRGTLSVSGGFVFQLPDPPTRVDVILRPEHDTVRLERTTTGWTVDGFRADSAKVANLLDVIVDLGSDLLVARNPGNHFAMGVSADSGRLVEVYTEAGGPLGFHLGKRDLAAGGYFVRQPGADAVFRLEGPAGGYLGRDRDGWRDRAIARVDTATVREIFIRRGDDELVIRRAPGIWQVDGAPADTSAVAGALRTLAAIGATGFPTDEEAAAADFTNPDIEVDIFAEAAGDVTDRDLVLSLRLIADDGGDWLIRKADDVEIYHLADYIVNRLVPERSALVDEPEP